MTNSPAGARALALRFALPTALASLWAVSGCVQPLNLPDVGDCAVYPEGLYDYGDLGIGTCLSGPVDLRSHVLPDGSWRLFVVNANPNLLYTSGSILSVDGAALERAASDGGLQLSSSVFGAPDQAGGFAYPSRTYSGPLAWDPDREAFYYGNRLSYTTANSAADRVEGVYLAADGSLRAFDAFDEEAGDGTYAQAGYDPFSLVRQPDSGQLYTLNMTSHDVTVFDTLEDRSPGIRYARTVQAAQLPEPVLVDQGSSSLLEVVFGELDEETLPPDRFTLTYTPPVRRLFYPVQSDGAWGLGFAESADSERWQPSGTGPVLRPATGNDAWDRGGIFGADVLEDGDSYVAFYVASDGEGPTGIGFASTPNAWAGEWSKYDAGVTDAHDDDAVLTPGTTGDDAGGIFHPSIYRPDETTFRMWFSQVGEDGIVRIGAARADNAIEWEKQGTVLTSDEPGASVTDPIVALRPLGGFRMFYIEGDLESSTCLRYAESASGGTSWVPGGIAGQAPGCLLSAADGLPPILRSPQVLTDQLQTTLWIAGADSPEGPFELYVARSSDLVSWEVQGQATFLAPADGVPELPRDLTALCLDPGATSIGTIRVEQDNVGVSAVGLTLGGTMEVLGLSFAVLAGHVLALPDWQEPWWGAPEGREVSEGVALEAPAILPELDRLLIDARQIDARARLGYAYPVEGDAPVGGQWALPTDGTGGLDGIAASGAAGVEGPWLMHPPGDDGTVWLFWGEQQQGGAWRIRRATSEDGGDTFSDLRTALSSVGEERISDPSVVWGHDGRYHLFYSSDLGGGREMRHATSADGATFAADDTSGLVAGEAGSWDDAAVSEPSVLWDDDAGVYYLWYTGSDGARDRIGYAVGTPSGAGITWERYRNASTNLRQAVVGSSGLGWDVEGVSDPVVLRDEDGVYRMWYQGRLGESSSRIGAEISRDGIQWLPLVAAPTAGDTLTLSTAPSRVVDSSDPKTDATITISYSDSQSTYDGRFATEIELVPVDVGGGATVDCFAVASSRRNATVWLFDVYDDSAAANDGQPGPCVQATNPTLAAEAGASFVDSNYNALEAIFLLENNLSIKGTRSIAFSPDHRRMYVTSAYPDALLVVDTTYFVDDAVNQAGQLNLPVLGFVELARGGAAANSDADNQTGINDYNEDIGPTGLVVSPLEGGRYVFVANGNEHSVYTIDTAMGAFGQVVAVSYGVGDIPYDLELSPDGTLLFVGAYVGEVVDNVTHSSMAILSADPTSEDFGQILAAIKNREL